MLKTYDLFASGAGDAIDAVIKLATIERAQNGIPGVEDGVLPSAKEEGFSCFKRGLTIAVKKE
jgi:hypothetical protein